MTPAISAGSTFLSLACWRMMSSWRSGSVISLTAWSAGRTRLSTATITSARPAPSVSRRRRTCMRRARERPDVRAWDRRAVAPGALMTSDRQLRKNPRQLLLQFAQSAGVLYSVGRSCRFLTLCELAGGALVERRVPARAGPLCPNGLVGDDRDRGVVVALEPRLEQQRGLDDQRTRRLRRLALAPLRHPRSDARPQQGLEELPLGVVHERAARDRRAIHHAPWRDLVAPARHHRGDLLGVRVE